VSQLKEKLSLLPDNPGCYLMRNEEKQVIYVGKASAHILQVVMMVKHKDW